MKHVEGRDGGNADERRRHEGEQDQLVAPGLIAMDEHLGAFSKKRWIDAVHGDRAEDPDDQQHREQYPGASPGERAGGDEQRARDHHCVGYDPYEYSKHRYTESRSNASAAPRAAVA